VVSCHSNIRAALEARQALALRGTSPVKAGDVIELQSEPPATVGTLSRVPSEAPNDRQVSTRNRKTKGKAALMEKSSDSPVPTAAPSRIPSEVPDGLQASTVSDKTVTAPAKKSAYELEREENIARNEALLERLGLNTPLVPAHKDTCRTAKPRPVKKTRNADPKPVEVPGVAEDLPQNSEHRTDAPLLRLVISLRHQAC
jgi:hypothetical protein